MSELESLKAELESARVEIERLKRVEMEARQSQKLEAVGALAAGIAHEVNTPIQYVGDSLFFIEESFEDLVRLLEAYQSGASKEDCEELAEEIDLEFILEQAPGAFQRTKQGVDRVSEIIKAMKEFSHPSMGEQAPADLNKGIRSTVTIARNEYKYVADLELDLQELPEVVCMVGELNQVFLNIIVNAAHAIGDRVAGGAPRGSITVRSQDCGDGEVLVTISDTGGGIPAEVQDRIFEPFFTTKEVGRGTGQGLAISRSVVVDKHQGSLNFRSVQGEGTTFEIRLPVGGIAERQAA